jgi:hypothetical protein
MQKWNPKDGEYEPYEPTDEELREIEEMIRQEEEARDVVDGISHKDSQYEKFKQRKPEPKNRVFYSYSSESHWAGWCRIHGIIW